jgi:poly(glycerol-phosphate) alpha-glucosyltransferase
MLDSWAVNNSRWRKCIASFCYEAAHLRDASCIRALCEAEAVAIRRYGVKNPIAIIPNGVDVPGETGPQDHGTTRPQTTEKGLQDHRPQDNRLSTTGRKTLLFLGRIHPKKGLVNLLKAWKQARAEDWVLAIAGWDDGGHLAQLKQLCDELNLRWEERRSSSLSSLPSSVAFLGPRFNAAKSSCFRECDAFILPSFSEGLPMAVLEAWSYGKPVLMTEYCHLPEGFTAGAAIKISTDVHELAHALNELVRISGADLSAMGNRGRDLVKTRFNWQNIGTQMRNVCDWVAAGGPRPECVRT